MNNKCDLKYCPGTLRYYDGALGYEAMVCSICGSHYTGGSPDNFNIAVDTKKYKQVVKRYKK